MKTFTMLLAIVLIGVAIFVCYYVGDMILQNNEKFEKEKKIVKVIGAIAVGFVVLFLLFKLIEKLPISEYRD